MNGSLHTYVKHQMFYFERYCTYVRRFHKGCNQNTFESNKLSLKTLEIKLKDNFSFQKFSRTLNRFSEKCAQNPKRWLDYSPTP